MRRLLLAAATWLLTTPAAAFDYLPAGDLPAGSGQGRVDDTIYAPGMRFPIESAPAFANSQVYGHGGYLGPGGGQCDPNNYSYPWRDNYCEKRSWNMPLCPSGTGHQGQDIRPATCDDNTHWAVATADGTITNIGSYSVYLTAPDGTRYDYLHMSTVQVSVGENVSRGQRLGFVSNEFGGTSTTIHLHFNIRQNVDGIGTVYVPPYMSLVSSYNKLVDGPATGYLDEVTCDVVRGWSYDQDDAEAPVPVTLSFSTSDAAAEATVLADFYRGDLCENLGFCDHGFEEPAPLSLFDGEPHEVRAHGGEGSNQAELTNSPKTMECAPFALEGVRRPIDDDTLAAFGMTAFWDELPADPDEIEALAVATEFAGLPEVVKDEDGELYLVDESRGVLRPLVSDRSAKFWRLDPALAIEDDGSLPIGSDLPVRPVIVRDEAGDPHLIDVAAGGTTDPGSGVGSGTGAGAGAGGGPGGAALEGHADCGCTVPGQSPRSGGSWLLLACAALLGRRAQREGRTKPCSVR